MPSSKDEHVRRRMMTQRRRDTRPELLLRKELHRRGLRFRIHYPVPGLSRRSVDVAFTKAKVAVFVDGCFWHGCPDHGVAPKHNASWWEEKLLTNVRRDRETSAHLHELGWVVVRLWEHQDVGQAADLVQQLVLARLQPPAEVPTL